MGLAPILASAIGALSIVSRPYPWGSGLPGGQRLDPRAGGPVWDSPTVWLFYSGSLGQRKKERGWVCRRG